MPMQPRPSADTVNPVRPSVRCSIGPPYRVFGGAYPSLGMPLAPQIPMTLDHDGVRLSCPSCQTTNRLRFDSLNRAAKCGKCHNQLPLPSSPIDVPNAELF